MNIVHRDIKPTNLVIKDPKNPNELNLIDFGFCVKATQLASDGEKNKTLVGSPGFMAPEMLLSKPYDTRADVFSAGVTLYILLFRKQPFYSNVKRDILKLNANCALEKCLQRDLKKNGNNSVTPYSLNLLKLMMEKDPELRPTASQLLEHSFVKVISSENLSKSTETLSTNYTTYESVTDNLEKVETFGFWKQVLSKNNLSKNMNENIMLEIQKMDKTKLSRLNSSIFTNLN